MAAGPLPNESMVLSQIAHGDQYAFSLLFRHYHGYVHSFGRKITRSHELATEIVQDIFLKIWLNREKLTTVENFGAYLNRIVRNHSFNVLRRLAQENKSNVVLQLNKTEMDYSTTQQLEYREIAHLLNEAIETLSPQQKMVYQLCHQEGLKYEDAAVKMNISSQTVHSYMKDALRKIRAHFKKHAIEYSIFIACFYK